MKVVFDLSVTTATQAVPSTLAPWDVAWQSPLTGTSPALVLDFVADAYGPGGNAGPLSSVLNLSRASNATRIDATGAVEVVGPNVARITHDQATLAPLGALLEPASANLVLNSDAPTTQTISVAAVPHVLSFSGTGGVTLSGAHSESILGNTVSNSRVSKSFTPAAGGLDLSVSGAVSNLQLEEGTRASSYIPSGPQSGVRSEDIAGTSLGGWFNPNEGTIVFSGALENASANDRIIEMDSGTTSTRLSVLWNTVLGKPQFQVWDQSALQAAIAPSGSAINLGDHFRFAVAFSQNSFAISLNGGPVATDGSGTMPSGLTTLRIGRSIWGAQAQMIAEGLTYYPTRLSDAELQALSS
ncbi:MAG: hypothetical protein ACSHXD_01595 [Marinosulfonomonas sp.]